MRENSDLLHIHIQLSRLFDVAESAFLTFTDFEFEHIRACRGCFAFWKQLIQSSPVKNVS